MTHAVEHLPTLNDALRYASLGLRVVPLHSLTATGKAPSCTCGQKSGCDAAGKHPRFGKWVEKATTDRDVIRQWWKDWPRSNVGIVTGEASGIVCLDIDPGHDGESSLAALVAEHGPLPATAEATTGGGGRHLIFRHPGGGLKIGNTQSNEAGKKLGPGLDIRGDGGQFVAAPSLHKSGRRYEWVAGREPWIVPPAPMPQWLVLMLTKPEAAANGTRTAPVGRGQRKALSKYGERGLENEINRILAAQPGTRNNDFNRAAFSVQQLVQGGALEESVADAALTDAAHKVGLGDGEIAATLASAKAAALAKPRDLRGLNGNGHAAPATGRQPPSAVAVPDEAHHSPRRLAKLYLEKHGSHADGHTLHYWREEWHRWNGTVYEPVEEKQLRAELAEFTHRTFVADWKHGDGEWEGRGDDARLVVRRVTTQLVGSVMQSLSGAVLLPEALEASSWVAGGEHRNFIAMRNGIIDINRLLAHQAGAVRPPTPNWFSPVCLPYEFSIEARCPTWLKFLQTNLEGDGERIALLQEWFGYCLLPDTSQQKFMLIVGEGANGKSVVCAALSALVGPENISAVPLELFGERFQLTSTLGKLVNIATEIGELDKAAEGHLKAFTSGDIMQFDRKGKSQVETSPTARLVLATNNLPRFSDKSGGVWRRMIYMPMNVTIDERDRVPGMDKAEWWLASGEMPGVFGWALVGLARLRRVGQFTAPAVCRDGLEQYRAESNPAKMFLEDDYASDPEGRVPCAELYESYRAWCKENGYSPLSERGFGREVYRVFKRVTRRKQQDGIERRYHYFGVIKRGT